MQEIMMAQPGGGYCQPNPSIQATYDFMEAIFRDQKEIFNAAMIHIGGDEGESCYKKLSSI
jgi:N-acetyl-beta-hexosaminidase